MLLFSCSCRKIPWMLVFDNWLVVLHILLIFPSIYLEFTTTNHECNSCRMIMAWLGWYFNSQYAHFVSSEYGSISNNTKIVPKRVDFPTESEFWHYLKTLMWKQGKSMEKSGTAHLPVLGTLAELHLQKDRRQCTRAHFTRRILHICSPTVYLLVNLLVGCPLMGDPAW